MKRQFVESAGFSGVTYLVAIFGKREKSDLSPAERRGVAALVKQLKEETS